jgi:hypothetical protein
MSKGRIGRALAVALVVMVALAGAEAFAMTCTASKTLSNQTCCSWKKTSSGYTYCALWCTGSEDFTNTMTGVGGNIFGNCDPTQPGTVCPTTTNQAFGTIDPATEGYDDLCNTELTNLSEDCALTGIAYCQNQGGNSKVKNPRVQGSPFLIPGVLGLDIPLNPQDCDKQGKCTTHGKLEAVSSIVCQNDNWIPLTFTASEFKAKSCFCPGGFADDGRCCSTTSRVGTSPKTECGVDNLWGSGYTLGKATCMLALCTVDLKTYDPFTNNSLAYDCQSKGVQFCGGDSGTCCPDDANCPVPPPAPPTP